ncbi:MAG TPA: rRNA methyltransferase, partial [Acidimicrobiia bacterium]|nr:rRNA methyltransferase [Acidimicrobiia bacterium]
MGAPIPVDDAGDPRLADFVDLSDPELRARVEGRAGFFVGEGPLVVARLLASSRHVRAVLVTATQYDALRVELDATPAPVYVAPPEVLRRVVGFDLHRGAVASADRFPLPDPTDLLRGARR